MPKLLYQDYFQKPYDQPLFSKFAIHHPTNVHQKRNYLEVPDNPYAFLRIVNHSPADFHRIYTSNEFRIEEWHSQIVKNHSILKFYSDWRHQDNDLLTSAQSFMILPNTTFPPEWIFTSRIEPIYGSNR